MLALLATAAVAAPARPPGGKPPSVLVSWSFDEPSIETGPDTLRVFQNARGRVELSSELRTSGFFSVKLSEVPLDGDFPELQGFFPPARDGRLALAFAILTTGASQELNVALAGPSGFHLGKDGIAFWLSTRDGWLFHTTDSIPKRLVPMLPFVWYTVFVDYDVARGRYDLSIGQEGETEPLLTLREQTNAGAHPGSVVSLFSFIGDNGDDSSSVTYFVDDVVVATDRSVVLPPFVAPGRRRFFVDLLAAPGADGKLPLRCPGLLAPTDLGLDAAALARLQAAGLLGRLADWTSGAAEPPRPGSPELAALPAEAAAVAGWRTGCGLLRLDPAGAEAALRRAVALQPGAPLLRLSWALALAGQKRWEEAEAQIAALPRWGEDPRLILIAATVASRQGAPEAALEWLAPQAARDLRRPADSLAARHYFHLLLALLRHDEAASFARDMAGALAGREAAAAWREREGDALFASRRLGEARAAYLAAGGGAEAPPMALMLKLADVAFLLGDEAGERVLREKVYGRLARASR